MKLKSVIGMALFCGIPAANAQLAGIANAGIGPFTSGLGVVTGLLQVTSALGLGQLQPILANGFVAGSNLLNPVVLLVTGLTAPGYGLLTTAAQPLLPLTGALPGLPQVENLLP